MFGEFTVHAERCSGGLESEEHVLGSLRVIFILASWPYMNQNRLPFIQIQTLLSEHAGSQTMSRNKMIDVECRITDGKL
jgi:hypothetical protein